MGLDTYVYCNCFETGRLKELPPYLDLLVITHDGGLVCKSNNLETLLEFDQWLSCRACEHKDGVLLHHRIGNIQQISLLRSELSREAEKFPISLQKILYNGTHTGDHLSLNDVESLRGELDCMIELICSNKKNQKYVDWFRWQFDQLRETALKVKKTISF